MRLYSYSKLSTYETCPQKYKFRYVDHLPSLKGAPATFGIAVHKAIADELLGKPSNILNLPMEDFFRAKEMVDSATEISRGLGEIVDIERRFAYDDGEVEWDRGYFRGIIDLITKVKGGLGVWDWKTGYKTPSVFQVSLYAYYMQKLYGKPVEKMGYVLLNTNSILEFDPSFIPQAKEKEEWLVKRIESDRNFKATPSEACSYCDYIDSCTLNRAVTEARNNIEAVKLYQSILVQKESLKKQQKILKGYVDNQAIDLGKGKVYSVELEPIYRKKKGYDFDTLIRELAMKHPELIKFDNAGLYDIHPEAFSVIQKKVYKER